MLNVRTTAASRATPVASSAGALELRVSAEGAATVSGVWTWLNHWAALVKASSSVSAKMRFRGFGSPSMVHL